MVESTAKIYDETRLHALKRLNLGIRGWIYRLAYLPKLKKFGVFENAEDAVEIGAGYGSKFYHTVTKIPNVTFRGVEASNEMLTRASDYYPIIAEKMELGEAQNLLMLESESQDVVMYYQILHHLDWGQLEEAIEEAQRVLRPGGKIAVIDTFLDDKFNFGFGLVRRIVFHTIEPIYALTSTRVKNLTGYKNKPQTAFVEFMQEYGFSLTHESKPFSKLSVSEILVFKKNE